MRLLTLLAVAALVPPAHAYQSINPVGDIQDTPGGSTTLSMDDDTKICLGDSCDYWVIYNSTGTQFELWSTDVDGGGTDGVVLATDDGDDIVDFTDGLIAAGTVQGGTVTDGTASSTGGAVTGVTTLGATGPVTVTHASGGTLNLVDSTTPGDAAGEGTINWVAESDASATRTMAVDAVDVTSAADGAEYADRVMSAIVNGSMTEMLRLDGSAGGVAIPSGKKLYQDGGGDLDTYMVESAEDQVDTFIGGTLISRNKDDQFSVRTSFLLLNVDPDFQLYTYDTTPSVGQSLGGMRWTSYDDTPLVKEYVSLKGFIVEEDAGDADGKITLKIIDDGVEDNPVVECDMQDASENCTAYYPWVVSGASGGEINLVDSTATGDTNGTGAVNFKANDDGGTEHTMASIQLDVTDASAGTEDAEGELRATTNGTDDTLYVTWGNNAVTLSQPLVVPTYEICNNVAGTSAFLGPTAPSHDTNQTTGGYGFDAVGETLNINWEIPSCWDGVSDLAFKVYWVPTEGDAVADTEDVDWEFVYRDINWGPANDDTDQGTAVTINADHLQSGAGDDHDTYETETAIDYDHADQPLTAGHVLSGVFNRDMANESNSYSGKGIVAEIEICYDSTTPVCDHY